MQGERNHEQDSIDVTDSSGAADEASRPAGEGTADAASEGAAAGDGTGDAPRRKRRRRRRKKGAGAGAEAATGEPSAEASGGAGERAGEASRGTEASGGGRPPQGGRGGHDVRDGSHGSHAQGGRGPNGGASAQGGRGSQGGGSPRSHEGRGSHGGRGSQGGGSPRSHEGRGSHGGRGSQGGRGFGGSGGGSSGGGSSSEPMVPIDSPALQTLAAGLFSHLDDRPMPCKVDGCENTWTWTAQEQIQMFGQAPPRRMCPEHVALLGGVGDREVPCANPGCERTWTWPKGAQLAQLQRTGSAEPPRKVCPECTKEERDLADREVSCRVEGCARTWTWTRDAQLKHRTWARRFAEEEAAGTAPPQSERGPGGKRRRRRKQRADVHEPPPRMCLPCRDKAAAIVEREVPCKVHGCTRMTVLDRESQLRAWAKLGTLDVNVDAPQARRMCESCREFCRTHPDREVACGRPGCDKTWTYKTGAQLQDSLAGRRQDPIRLCEECSRGGLAGLAVGAPEGTEVMPCVVPLCDGVWFYREGVTDVSRLPSEALPLDRMCDRCRGERGAEPRRAEMVAEATHPAEPHAGDDAAASVPSEGVAGEAAANEAEAANEAAAANEAMAANDPVAANDPALDDEAVAVDGEPSDPSRSE